MTNRTLLTILLLVFSNIILGQTTILKLNKAFELYDSKQYDNSYKQFNTLKNEILPTDTLFKDLAFGLTASTYFRQLKAKNANDWDNTVLLANEFLKDLDVYNNFINEGLLEKRYFAYKDLIVAYLGLNKRDSASVYQKKLYEAYSKKMLPDGINKSYNFQKLNWNSLNVWGYEWYANLGEKETEGSFSKQVYYVYSADSLGQDKNLLFRLHSLKIHKLTPDDPKADYVLTYYKPNKDGSEGSKTLWKYTFSNPIDNIELEKAILDFLEKNKQQILELAKSK